MKCLVTKLESEINNKDLQYIDKANLKVVSFKNPTEQSRGFHISYNEDAVITLEGVYSTDASFSENLGNTITLKNNQYSGVIISNGNGNVLIPLKGLKTLNPRAGRYSEKMDFIMDETVMKRIIAWNKDILISLSDFGVLTMDALVPLKNLEVLNFVGFHDKDAFSIDLNKFVEEHIDAGCTVGKKLSITSNGKFHDYYGNISIGSTRHFFVNSATSYICKNQAETEILYTVNKVGSGWVKQ